MENTSITEYMNASPEYMRAESPSPQAIEHYQNGVDDYIVNAHHRHHLNLIPVPFPQAPELTVWDSRHFIDTDTTQIPNPDYGKPRETGVLGMPKEDVRLRFARAGDVSKNTLVIVLL